MDLKSRGFTAKRLFETTLTWTLNLIFTVTRSREFMMLMPPVSPVQIVLDIKRRRLIRFQEATFYDIGTLMEIFVRREYIPESPSFLRGIHGHYDRIVSQGFRPLIVDFGANVGASAALFSLYFPEATIVAVEPEPKNFEKLKRLALQFPNIIPVNAAVGPSSGSVNLYEGLTPGNHGFRTFGSSEDALLGSVSCIEPDYAVSLGGQAVPFLVKIDIEGYESQLFSGESAWIDRFPVVMAEPHDWMIPGKGVSRGLITALTRIERDFILSGENILACATKM